MNLLERVLVTLAVVLVCAGCAIRPDRALGDPFPRKPGTYDLSASFGGLRRTYRLHLPPSYRPGARPPLVLVFHGRYGTGRQQERISGFDSVADRHAFVVAYPDGIGRSWNAANGVGVAERRHVDDVAFVASLVAALARRIGVDRRRVYAAGLSNGATFVYRLACDRPGLVAAVAAVAGTISDATAAHCKPARPVPVLQISGTADPISPWRGGHTRGGGSIESVPETVSTWARNNGCRRRASVRRLAPDVVRVSYPACRASSEVVLYRVEGGGHTWPGGVQYLPSFVIGPTSRSLSASEAIWRFFARHHR